MENSKTKEWNEKGYVLNKLGRYSEALQCYDEAIKLDPKSIDTWNNKGYMFNNLEKYSEAIQCFDKVIKLDPKYVSAWNNKGILLRKLRKYSEALQCFDEVIKLDPKYKKVWNNKGDLLYKLGTYSEAIQCYDEAIKLDPKNVSAWNNKGLSLYNFKKYSESLQCFDEVIKLDPKYEKVWNNKGNALYKLGKFSEALQCYEEAIKLDPKSIDTWNSKGNSLNKLEKNDEAIQCYDKAIKLNPNYSDAWNNKGNSFDILGRYSEAIQCFNEAIKLNPNCIDAWNGKGSSFSNLGKYNEAIQCFNEAIKLDPNYLLAWNNKGWSLYALDKYSEAIQCFDEAIKLDPKYPLAWNNKLYILYGLGKYDEAIQCCNEAIQIDSRNIYVLNIKGNSLRKLGKFDEGLECLKKGVQLNPKYKEGLNDIGRIYIKKGDFVKAIEYFDECLKIDNNFEEAILNKERINNIRNVSTEIYFHEILEDLKQNKLCKLDLRDLNIGDNDCKLLSEILKLNFSLKELILEDNNIGNEGISYLNEVLKINYSLQILKLKYNFFDNFEVLKEIENKLEKNRNSTKFQNSIVDWNHILFKKNEIKILIINNCNLKDVPNEINQLQEIIILDLQANQLIQIPNLSKLNKLVILNLSKNNVKLEINERLYSELCIKLPNSIEYLLLEGNEEMYNYLGAINITLNRNKLENELTASSTFFFWLCLMNKIEISIEKSIQIVRDLKTSQILNLNSNMLSILPKDISNLANLCTQLDLMNNRFSEFPESILSLNNLNSLILRNNNISSLPENISKLTNLTEITLQKNKLKNGSIKHLSKFKSMKSIWLDSNSISKISKKYVFSNLEIFSISQNRLTEFGGIIEWTKLEILVLNENNIEIIPKEIRKLTRLKKFYLDKNKIKSIPIEIKELKELRYFYIGNNLIEEIPTAIGELIKLETIDFSYNKIEMLPASMGLLTNLKNLNIEGNTITNPPIEITKNFEKLKGYWKDLLIGEERCNYLKLIIVGEENVGKTTLVKTLNVYNNSIMLPAWSVGYEFKNKPLSTDGINISMQSIKLYIDRSYSLPNNLINLNIWDFGGQKIYHSTHIFFLSPNSVYLIVWNMSESNDKLKGVIYWIQTINSYIKEPMIILVGTHLDQIQTKNNPNIIEDIYDNIHNQTKIPKEFIIGVSCKYGTNYDKLLQVIKLYALEGTNSPKSNEDILKDISSLSLADISSSLEKKANPKNLKSMVGQIFPKMYLDLKKIIDEEGTKLIKNNLPPILELNEFEKITQKSYIFGEELKRGLFFLNCLGFCLYFSKDKELSEYIILSSQWLADTMATLITTKSNFIQNGLIDHQLFNQAWREPKYPSKIHPILFELLQKFHVLIPIIHNIKGNLYEGKSLVPALLSNQEKPIDLINWNEGRKIKLQRIYEFTLFLPSQIFPQFMATVFSLIGIRDAQYWRDGILIKKDKVKCLIELDVLNKFLVISFAGKKFISLFKQITIKLEMVLKNWENLSSETYITCPNCASSQNSNRNKCFKLKECFDASSNQISGLFCNHLSKKNENDEISIQVLLPELTAEIKHLVEWDEIVEENIKLGEGSFAEIYKGIYQNQTVVIKKLKMENNDDNENSNENNSISEEYVKAFLLEIEILSNIKHNNILNFIGIVLSPPSIILPFANYGSLFNLIHKHLNREMTGNNNHILEDINYSVELVLRIGLDICLGLDYLHSLNPSIIHSNLSSETILIMNIDYKHRECVCKINDFESSQLSIGKVINKNLNLKLGWTAPELIEKRNQTIYSDIYSFGMILYELLTKEIPYSIQQNSEWNINEKLKRSILEGIKPIYSKEKIENEFKTQIPNQIYEIMEACWKNNSIDRPTSRSIIKLFYEELSKYWNEIKYFIKPPFSLDQPENGFVEIKNEESIQKIKEISEGTYGIVFLCKMKKLSEEKEYILKEMKTNIPESKKKKVEDSFQIELEILKKINSSKPHQNVVQLIGYYVNLNQNRFWIILEYCNGGSLEKHLKQKINEQKDLKEVRRFFKDILLGTKYLHENGYAHLDLKPDNILLRKENNKIINLCLCDLGTCRPQNNFELEIELIGSYNYMAPEVYRFHKNKPQSDESHQMEIEGYNGMKADIWSLGIILFRMLGETFPFDGPFEKSLPLSTTHQSPLFNLFQNVYSKCTQVYPINRPSVSQILVWVEEKTYKQTDHSNFF